MIDVPVGAVDCEGVKLATGERSCRVTAVDDVPLLGGIGESVAFTMSDQRPPGSEACGVYEPTQN